MRLGTRVFKKHSLEKAIYDSGHYRPINQLPALLFFDNDSIIMEKRYVTVTFFPCGYYSVDKAFFVLTTGLIKYLRSPALQSTADLKMEIYYR